MNTYGPFFTLYHVLFRNAHNCHRCSCISAVDPSSLVAKAARPVLHFYMTHEGYTYQEQQLLVAQAHDGVLVYGVTNEPALSTRQVGEPVINFQPKLCILEQHLLTWISNICSRTCCAVSSHLLWTSVYIFRSTWAHTSGSTQEEDQRRTFSSYSCTKSFTIFCGVRL